MVRASSWRGYVGQMAADFGALFRVLAMGTLVGVPLFAWRTRGRAYAIFGFALLAFSIPGAWVTQVRISAWIAPELRTLLDAAFAAGMAATAGHLIHLTRARMRSRGFRALVSVPGQMFLAAGFMAGFWQLALVLPRLGLAWAGFQETLSLLHWLDGLPYVVAGLSVMTSAQRVTEWVRIPLGEDPPAHSRPADGRQVWRLPVERHRHRAPALRTHGSDGGGRSRPLRIVQIADPHLGPWQSVARLRRTLEDLLVHEPDLVLLTGDFLTMEGQGSSGALAQALEPLGRVSERCFAVFGNHDHESPDEVRSALAANGICLLEDGEALVSTPAETVQILGAHYHRRDRGEHLARLFARYPRREGVPRLLLLHDPLGFRDVPDGEADLTLSGHTHGGQVGLVSFGLDWTVLSRSRWPDHGLFACGSNRLYVHRGTGFYGFPLRVGVPGEVSVMELVWS